MIGVINVKKGNVIYSINGPVVTVRGASGFSMMEMVYVGGKKLIGEVDRKSVV